MIHCKKYIIATCFSLLFPMLSWSEAIVVDDSEHFAMGDEQQGQVSVAQPKYEQMEIENAQIDNPRNEKYASDRAQDDDGPALAKDDQVANGVHDAANMIDKIQSLQRDIQELRGQLEVQSHDLKLLQQQQLSFYKDLDSRMGSVAAKSSSNTKPTDLDKIEKKASISSSVTNKTVVSVDKTNKVAAVPTPASQAAKTNPADEQISYLAAYELIKNKRYDDAINAMQTFIQKYPQGGYTANAEYWLGELYMVKKDFAKSIEHFEVVLQKYPSSSKSAAAMLKAGYAYAASGHMNEAKNHLQQVVKTYPGTPTAQLANLKLESINAL